MNKKTLNIIGAISIIAFVTLIFVDFFLNELTKNQEIVIKILEILTASSGASTVSMSFTLTINENSKTNQVKLKDASDNDVVQQNGEVNVVDKSTHNDPETFVKVVKECLVPYQQENMENVARKTYEALEKEKTGVPLSKDFVLKYLSECSTISNNDIQDIWVKLLIQENKNSGSVSKRTLDIVKNLSPTEAILFEQIAQKSLNNGLINKEMVNTIPFINISKLKDIGLLKSNDFITQHLKITPNVPYLLVEDKIVLVINNSGSSLSDIEVSCEMLTSEGLELKNALDLKMSTVDYIEFCKLVKNNVSNNSNLKVSAHNVNYINGNQVNYQLTDLL